MRYYTKDGKDYRSVTSILGEMFPFDQKSFDNWCKKNGYDPKMVNVLSTSMGSKVSDWIDNNYRGLEELNPPVIGKLEQGLYNAVQDFLKEAKLLSTEETVYCDEYMYAGTYDGIIEYKGEKYLADWKTFGAWKGEYKRTPEKIKKVELQLNMYRYALQEKLPLLVVIFKTDGTYETEKLGRNNKWKEWIENNPPI